MAWTAGDWPLLPIRKTYMKQIIRLDREQTEMVDDVMAEVLSGKTATERLQIGFGLWKSARDMLFSHLRSSNPEWDETKLNREVAKRLSHGVI